MEDYKWISNDPSYPCSTLNYSNMGYFVEMSCPGWQIPLEISKRTSQSLTGASDALEALVQ